MSTDNWTRVADERLFDEDPMQVFEVEDELILVCRIAGRYYAVEDRCSHDDGPLGDGHLEDHCVVCPRHGAKFDMTNGAAVTMPAVTGIRSYPVKAEAGGVWVSVD